MTIKQKIKEWLEVPDPPKHDYTAEFDESLTKALNKLDRSFTQRIARFSIINCSVCDKALIAGRDPVFRNSKGTVFCSHNCIDAPPKELNDER